MHRRCPSPRSRRSSSCNGCGIRSACRCRDSRRLPLRAPKALPYELKVLSFSAGATRKPQFVALNPRHQVPTLVDGDFVLYESNAIVEYLDEAYPGRGAPLFPGDARSRAIVRRLVLEVDNYFSKATDPLLDQAFWKKPEERDAQKIAEGRKSVVDELV